MECNTNAHTYILIGYYVPKSDGEFYQFCYVTHAGDIRGASTPFQFRSATPTEELLTVTEDDSNSDILVVTTKTGLLEVRHTRSRYFFLNFSGLGAPTQGYNIQYIIKHKLNFI